MIRNGEAGLRDWLETSEGGDVLDDAVLGCLPLNDVHEIAEDFGVSVATFRKLVNEALESGY